MSLYYVRLILPNCTCGRATESADSTQKLGFAKTLTDLPKETAKTAIYLMRECDRKKVRSQNTKPIAQAKQTVSKPVTRKSVISQYILSLDLGHLRVLINLWD